MDHRTLLDLQFARVVEAAADACQTAPGRRRVLECVPFRHPRMCDEDLARVEEALCLLDLAEHPSLDGVEDVGAAIASTAKGGVLSAGELIACARMLQAGHEARRILLAARLRTPTLAEWFLEVKDMGAVGDRIAATFDEDGGIRDDASPRLGELRSRAVALGRKVKALIEGMVTDPKMRALLQDDYYTLREGRYVLPVKAEDHRFVPGIIHGSSQTGQTLYVEPSSIVEENNQLKVVLEQIVVEEHAVLADRSALVARFAGECREVAEALWLLDSLLGRARLARRMGGSRPVLAVEGEGLDLRGARNPILVLLGRDVVPISVQMGPAGGRALIVSGPNAGGKSVTLSTIGLSCVMARHGLLPPTSAGSIVPWYDLVVTVTGDPTNMDRAVSTFTGQLARLNDALDRPPGRALVLVDELATGTEPRKGEALATAIVEGLVGSGAECVVATHYEGPKHLAAQDPSRYENARVGLDATGHPTYSLELGAPGESNPFEVAAAVGFRPDILERARALTGEREQRLEEALAEARRLNAELLEEKAETNDLKRRLVEDKRRYEKELVRLRTDADRLVYEARRDVLQKMKRLEDELDEIAKQAREERAKPKPLGQPGAESVVVRRQEVRDKKAEVRRDMDREAAVMEDLGDPLPASELKVGARVYVASVRAEGTVTDVAADGKRCTVQVGLMKANAKLADLRRPKPKTAAPAKPSRFTAPEVPKRDPKPDTQAGAPGGAEADGKFYRTDRNSVDVRGQRLDEALNAVDQMLDQAFLTEEAAVMIIHGMGTSALRNGIREYLKKSRYCRGFRSGAIDEGGEGVTIADLKL